MIQIKKVKEVFDCETKSLESETLKKTANVKEARLTHYLAETAPERGARFEIIPKVSIRTVNKVLMIEDLNSLLFPIVATIRGRSKLIPSKGLWAFENIDETKRISRKKVKANMIIISSELPDLSLSVRLEIGNSKDVSEEKVFSLACFLLNLDQSLEQCGLQTSNLNPSSILYQSFPGYKYKFWLNEILASRFHILEHPQNEECLNFLWLLFAATGKEISKELKEGDENQIKKGLIDTLLSAFPAKSTRLHDLVKLFANESSLQAIASVFRSNQLGLDSWSRYRGSKRMSEEMRYVKKGSQTLTTNMFRLLIQSSSLDNITNLLKGVKPIKRRLNPRWPIVPFKFNCWETR
eukprot:TRINITY_DN2002_c0_g1_i10.p1 TRINITY_DN2002_c0_g1~~TRINITY_DN2002_c0_g1_i10.p1  ORF type:complete len:352 (-),score=20.25 TRINITY_DN2002_c0_g1_i10:539-1594(-)